MSSAMTPRPSTKVSARPSRASTHPSSSSSEQHRASSSSPHRHRSRSSSQSPASSLSSRSRSAQEDNHMDVDADEMDVAEDSRINRSTGHADDENDDHPDYSDDDDDPPAEGGEDGEDGDGDRVPIKSDAAASSSSSSSSSSNVGSKRVLTARSKPGPKKARLRYPQVVAQAGADEARELVDYNAAFELEVKEHHPALTISDDYDMETCRIVFLELQTKFAEQRKASFNLSWAILVMKIEFARAFGIEAKVAEEMLIRIFERVGRNLTHALTVSKRNFPNYVIDTPEFANVLTRQYLHFVDKLTKAGGANYITVMVLEPFRLACCKAKDIGLADFEKSITGIFDTILTSPAPKKVARNRKNSNASSSSSSMNDDEAAASDYEEEEEKTTTRSRRGSGVAPKKKPGKDANDSPAGPAGAAGLINPPSAERSGVDAMMNEPTYVTSAVEVVHIGASSALTEPLNQLQSIKHDLDQGNAHLYSVHPDDEDALAHCTNRCSRYSLASKLPVWTTLDNVRMLLVRPSTAISQLALQHRTAAPLANVTPEWAMQNISSLMSTVDESSSAPYMADSQHASVYPEQLATHPAEYWNRRIVDNSAAANPADVPMDIAPPSSSSPAPSSSDSPGRLATASDINANLVLRAKELVNSSWPTVDGRPPPLCFEAWTARPSSLVYHIGDQAFKYAPALRSKVEVDIGTTVSNSRLHDSPLHMRLYYHQKAGSTLWLLIHPSQRAKLIDMLARVLVTEHEVSGRDVGALSFMPSLADLYLSAHVFLPTPTELTIANIDFTTVQVNAGHVLSVPGDVLRMFVNVPGTVSVGRTFYDLPVDVLRESRMLCHLNAIFARVVEIAGMTGTERFTYAPDAVLAKSLDHAAPFDAVVSLVSSIQGLPRGTFMRDGGAGPLNGVSARDAEQMDRFCCNIKTHLANTDVHALYKAVGCKHWGAADLPALTAEASEASAQVMIPPAMLHDAVSSGTAETSRRGALVHVVPDLSLEARIVSARGRCNDDIKEQIRVTHDEIFGTYISVAGCVTCELVVEEVMKHELKLFRGSKQAVKSANAFVKAKWLAAPPSSQSAIDDVEMSLKVFDSEFGGRSILRSSLESAVLLIRGWMLRQPASSRAHRLAACSGGLASFCTEIIRAAKAPRGDRMSRFIEWQTHEVVCEGLKSNLMKVGIQLDKRSDVAYAQQIGYCMTLVEQNYDRIKNAAVDQDALAKACMEAADASVKDVCLLLQRGILNEQQIEDARATSAIVDIDKRVMHQLIHVQSVQELCQLRHVQGAPNAVVRAFTNDQVAAACNEITTRERAQASNSYHSIKHAYSATPHRPCTQIALMKLLIISDYIWYEQKLTKKIVTSSAAAGSSSSSSVSQHSLSGTDPAFKDFATAYAARVATSKGAKQLDRAVESLFTASPQLKARALKHCVATRVILEGYTTLIASAIEFSKMDDVFDCSMVFAAWHRRCLAEVYAAGGATLEGDALALEPGWYNQCPNFILDKDQSHSIDAQFIVMYPFVKQDTQLTRKMFRADVLRIAIQRVVQSADGQSRTTAINVAHADLVTAITEAKVNMAVVAPKPAKPMTKAALLSAESTKKREDESNSKKQKQLRLERLRAPIGAVGDVRKLTKANIDSDIVALTAALKGDGDATRQPANWYYISSASADGRKEIAAAKMKMVGPVRAMSSATLKSLKMCGTLLLDKSDAEQDSQADSSMHIMAVYFVDTGVDSDVAVGFGLNRIVQHGAAEGIALRLHTCVTISAAWELFAKHVRQDAAEASPMIISVNLKHLATSVEIVDEFPNSNQLIEINSF